MDAHKAVFLFPVTKALRVQKERLEKEGEKYNISEVDDPIEAGQVLSMAPSGILFCSDTKKLLKCLEKYEKLFNDSKYKIILVLPKRIMGKEVADLNNKGVQDILVEPITEKALTTKVEFNFKMISKLIEAALKKAKRAEDAEKARQDALLLKKEQDQKKKQKDEERQKKKSIDSFWSDQEKAAQDLMFKPVEGKVKDGTDKILKIEDSALSLNSLNLFHNQLDGLNKTIKEKVESKQPEEEKKKKTIFNFDGNDEIKSHEAGDQSTNEADKFDDTMKKKNGLMFEHSDKLDANFTGNQNEADKVDEVQKSKNGMIIGNDEIQQKNLTGTQISVDNIEQSKSKNLNNFVEPEIEKKLSADVLPEEALKMTEGSSSLLNPQDAVAQNSTGSGSTENIQAQMQVNKSSIDINDKTEDTLKSNSNFVDAGINAAATSNSNFNEADQANGIKGQTTTQDHVEAKSVGQTTAAAENKEINQSGKGLGVVESHDQKTLGSGGSSVEESNLNKTPSMGIKDATEAVAKASTITPATKEEAVSKGVTEAKAETLNPEIAKKTLAEAVIENKEVSEVKSIAESLEPNKKGKGDALNMEKVDKAVNGFTEDPTKNDKVIKIDVVQKQEVNKKVEFESNFVDEFTKAKVEEKAETVKSNVVPLDPKKLNQLEDINSVIFNEPPHHIVKASLNSIDLGITMLHKLSTAEQKVEEQAFIFPMIGKKIYEDSQGLVTFYVMDPKAGPTLLYSSHKERTDFYGSLGLPPVEEYVTKNILTWQTYRYSTLNDETLQKDLIQIVYPFREGARTLGVAVVHCLKTIKETKDVSRIEMFLEFTRGYFTRFHNIGSQGGSSKGKAEAVEAPKAWYQKYLDQFNAWLNKNAKPEETKKEETKSDKVKQIKKPPGKKGAA